MRVKSVCTSALGLVLTGCASEQLNFNTLEIASTVASLQTKQALANIAAFIDDYDTTPAQVVISAGSISTTNSVTPSVTESLTKANALVGAASATRTALQSATQAGTNQSSQSWSVQPVTDAFQLKRLSVLYLFAATQDPGVLSKYPPHTGYVGKPGSAPTNPYPDPALSSLLGTIDNSNKLLCNDWLYYTGKSAMDGRERPVPPGDVAVPLGRYGNHELYTTLSAKERQCLSNFMLFISVATGETASPTNTVSKAGGQKPNALYDYLYTPDAAPK